MYHLHDGGQSKVVQLPIYGGAADIVEGALIVPGITADQDASVFIAAPGAGSTAIADIVGILNRLHDYSEVGDSAPAHNTAPTHVLQPVRLIMPGDEIGIEYNQSVDVDVASGTTTATTITNLQDAYDGGWLYVTSGTAVGQLMYCEASASGSVNHPTVTTATDSTSDVIAIVPVGLGQLALSANGRDANTYAASTNYVLNAFVLRNQFTYDGKSGWETLRPDRHHDLQLNGKNAKFRATVFLQNLAAAPID